ncbi:hypothetical protein VaNZ11_004882 [Volvox africanus]|uniref:RAP domain-containing protein n=1 Tax=Volvox africanus TaxID=51714 RepID=A0ABQ5RXH0_9CHLO|nr:hypothetical protein VaNZ11_004882 [Volvox africanus]
MILTELLPRCNIPQAEARITTTSTWLESQHVSDAARLHLISARRKYSCSCVAAAQPSAGTRDAKKRSPQAFPQIHRGQRSQRNQTNWQHHQSCNQSILDPRAKKLVEELGLLGWQCKSLRQSQLPPGNLESAGTLTAALLPYVPGLPAADLAHCCWALAQIGPAGARDPAVMKFVVAVQQELLASTTAVGDASALSSSRDEPAGGTCPGKGGGKELESPTGPLTHGTPGHDRSAAAVEPLPPRRDRRPRCAVRLSELDPKHISKLAWAVAKMGIRPTTAASAVRSTEVGGSLADAAAADGWRELQLHWWRELGLAAAAAIRRVQMPPQALCNTLWGFATCGQRHPELLEAAAQCIARGLRTRYGPQGVASLFWAFSSLGSANTNTWVRGVPAAGGGSFNDVYDQMYDMLIRLAAPLLDVMTMQHLSNVAWGLVMARLHVRQPAARRLMAAVCERATELTSAAAASAAAATAAVALPDDWPAAVPQPAVVLSNLRGLMIADVEEEEELGGRDGSFVRHLTHRTDLQWYDPQSMSVLAWSLAQVAPPGHRLYVSYLEAVVSVALSVRPGLVAFGDQDLAMLLMAHFHVRHYSAALVSGVRQEVLHRLQQREMDPQALTNICYCLATSNYYNEELYEAVATAAARSLERYGPALASRLVWSTSRARHYSPQLLAAFSNYIRPRLAECSPLDLVAAATALAQFHHYEPGLFRALAEEALSRTATPSAVAATAVAASTRHLASSPAATAAEGAAVAVAAAASQSAEVASAAGGGRRRLTLAGSRQLPPRALVNLLWSFAVLNHVDEALLAVLLERLRGLDVRMLGVPAVMQLCQTQVMLQDLYGNIIKPPEVLTQAQMELARATWQRVSSAATTVSRLQRDVVSCLQRLGTNPRCERVTLDGLFSIDTSLEWGGRRVAVEVDGPSHFTCSRPFRPLGRTLAKRRCLEMRGWRVLSVPGHEWRALGGHPEIEERYMRAALDGVLWRTHVLEGLSPATPSSPGVSS